MKLPDSIQIRIPKELLLKDPKDGTSSDLKKSQLTVEIRFSKHHYIYHTYNVKTIRHWGDPELILERQK